MPTSRAFPGLTLGKRGRRYVIVSDEDTAPAPGDVARRAKRMRELRRVIGDEEDARQLQAFSNVKRSAPRAAKARAARQMARKRDLEDGVRKRARARARLSEDDADADTDTVRMQMDVEEPEGPQSPKEHIRAFARATGVELKPPPAGSSYVRPSLSLLPGCDAFCGIELVHYVSALCQVHTSRIREALTNCTMGETAFNDIAVDEATWALSFAPEKTKSTRSRVGAAADAVPPPFLESPLDVMLLVRRLALKAFSNDSDAVRLRLSKVWYMHETLTKDALDLATTIAEMWSKQHEHRANQECVQCEVFDAALQYVAVLCRNELSPFLKRPAGIYSLSPKHCRILYVLNSAGDAGLPALVNSGLTYVSEAKHSGHARHALQEIILLHVLPLQPREPSVLEHDEVWLRYKGTVKAMLDSVSVQNSFWSTVVHFTLQRILKCPLGKQQRLVAGYPLALAFMGSLLSNQAASRALHESQPKTRQLLLRAVLKLMENIARSPLVMMLEAEKSNSDYPSAFTAIDLVRKVLRSAMLQREFVSSTDQGVRDRFMAAIEKLVMSGSKLVQDTSLSQGVDFMAYAHSCALGGSGQTVDAPDDISEDSESSEEDRLPNGEEADVAEATRTSIARHRSLAFVAVVVGSLGRSLEDGSRDISHMNTLRALFASRFHNLRNLMRLWQAVFQLQRGLHRYIPQRRRRSLGKVDNSETGDVLISDSDRDYFAMVVECIRAQVVTEQKERSSGSRSLTPTPLTLFDVDAVIEDVADTAVPRALQSPAIAMPLASSMNCLRQVACSDNGYMSFEDDTQLLGLAMTRLKSRGDTVLARYDPDSSVAMPWKMLRKSNVYEPGARDLLERSEKASGAMCECLPIMCKHGGPADATKRIACSNELCENRVMKVECVPGKCGAGQYCKNQRMQNRENAKFKKVSFPGKGVGIVADTPIPAGTFIGEYQGEVISMETFGKRMVEYAGERHFYFMTLTSKLVIDASRKSQATRFINHSCDPNAETQKWNAGGEPRVGIFAKRDIRKSEEITFDYGARSLANDTVPCLCDSDKCRGWLTKKKNGSPDFGSSSEVTLAVKPVDRSGFVTPDRNDDLQGTASAEESSDEDSQDESPGAAKRTKSLKDKLAKAQQDLKWAAELETSIKMLRGRESSRAAFDESGIDETRRKKLQNWESQLAPSSRSCFDDVSLFGNTREAQAQASFRIPRKQGNSVSPRALVIDRVQERKRHCSVQPEDRNLASNGGPRPVLNSVEHRRSSYLRNERFGSTGGMTIVKPEAVSAIAQGGPKTVERPRPVNRPAPGLSRAQSRFQPTRQDYVRKSAAAPPVKPSDSDSESGLSVASSASLFIEEPPTFSASHADGPGSDDEFVEAPPVEAMPIAAQVRRPQSRSAVPPPGVSFPSGRTPTISGHGFCDAVDATRARASGYQDFKRLGDNAHRDLLGIRHPIAQAGDKSCAPPQPSHHQPSQDVSFGLHNRKRGFPNGSRADASFDSMEWTPLSGRMDAAGARSGLRMHQNDLGSKPDDYGVADRVVSPSLPPQDGRYAHAAPARQNGFRYQDATPGPWVKPVGRKASDAVGPGRANLERNGEARAKTNGSDRYRFHEASRLPRDLRHGHPPHEARREGNGSVEKPSMVLDGQQRDQPRNQLPTQKPKPITGSRSTAPGGRSMGVPPILLRGIAVGRVVSPRIGDRYTNDKPYKMPKDRLVKCSRSIPSSQYGRSLQPALERRDHDTPPPRFGKVRSAHEAVHPRGPPIAAELNPVATKPDHGTGPGRNHGLKTELSAECGTSDVRDVAEKSVDPSSWARSSIRDGVLGTTRRRAARSASPSRDGHGPYLYQGDRRYSVGQKSGGVRNHGLTDVKTGEQRGVRDLRDVLDKRRSRS